MPFSISLASRQLSYRSDTTPHTSLGESPEPAIANLVAVELDRHIEERMKTLPGSARNWRYSRYADDLVISCTKRQPPPVLNDVRTLLVDAINQMGWAEASEKTKIWYGTGKPLYVCGIRVPTYEGDALALPRKDKRRLRAALHHMRNDRGTDEDRGLIAYAYDVTGDHRYRALTSTRTRSLLFEFALTLFPKEQLADFGRTWMET